MKKVAVIGLGHRIARIWPDIAAAGTGRIDLVGYADPNPFGKASLEGAGFDCGVGYDDHRVMLRELRPDVVMVGSPNHLHLDHIRDGLAIGAQVFTEKPVTISLEDSFAVAELIRRAGPDRLQVGLVLRCSPLFRAVQKALHRLGPLVSLEANEHLSPDHGGFIMRNWRRKRRWAGSHILEKCCHDIDLLQALSGRARTVASFGGRSVYRPAYAAMAKGPSSTGFPRYGKWPCGWEGIDDSFSNDVDVLDHQVVIMETESDVRITFHANCHAPLGERRWLIHGVQGSLDCEFGSGRARLREAWQDVEDLTLPNADRGGHYGADSGMGKDLVAAWLDDRPFPVPAKAALEAGLTCIAIDQAQQEAALVDVRPWMDRLDSILP